MYKGDLCAHDIARKLTQTFMGMTMAQAQDYIKLCALADSIGA